MKRTNLLLSAIILASVSINANAQWFGSPINTWTTSNVGVGVTTLPTDANLEIKANVSGMGLSIPHLKIDRFSPSSAEMGYVYPNYVEIWNHPAAVLGVSQPPVLLDVVNTVGWLGILNAAPAAALHVNGNGIIGTGITAGAAGDVLTVRNRIGLFSPADAAYDRGINGNSSTGGLFLYSKTSFNDGGSGIELWGSNNTSFPGNIHFICGGSDTTTGFQFVNLTSPGYHSYMNINKTGSVVIAGPGHNVEDIPVPGGYGLYVGVGILTEKLKVATLGGGNWSDFVFDKDYSLMSLSKVEDYIRTNKHLPEIPSAGEVAKDGIDVASMDAKLLQKIEELTLYVIQQQKEIDELKKNK